MSDVTSRELAAKMLDLAAEGLLSFSEPCRPKWLVMQNIKSQPFFHGRNELIEPEYVTFRRPAPYSVSNEHAND